MTTTIDHPDAEIHIEDLGEKRSISVIPKGDYYVPIKKWETKYPMDLIQKILSIKGPGFLCDEIMRDEDPEYVEHSLYWDLLSYVDQIDFKGRRILDFGSGSGASTMILSRLFPESQIIGVELVPEFLDIAQDRAKFYGNSDRIHFLLSPDPNSLPKDVGEFDHIIFSAVYEHLLPGERQVILPLLWSHLKNDGFLFIDQTPYRWFPIESHTTGLPFINYLPDNLALIYARKFSKRINPDSSWIDLLRNGIRGGTTKEMIDILRETGKEPELIEPSKLGIKDRIDLWFHLSSTARKPLRKKIWLLLFRTIKLFSGRTIIPTLSLAFKKN